MPLTPERSIVPHMNIITTHRSPNFTDLTIPVEFVVLHYTAATLERTMEIFMDSAREVSAHLVIDLDGSVYEMVPCLSGNALRAWHAGKSRFDISVGGRARTVDGFNDRSIGIELVNLNGNIFPYTELQYNSLFSVIERLKGLYPNLKRPESIVGHEQIAGFRGKCDPGRCFEWDRFFALCYPQQGAPGRNYVCQEPLAVKVSELAKSLGVRRDPATGLIETPAAISDTFFSHLSALCESALSKE